MAYLQLTALTQVYSEKGQQTDHKKKRKKLDKERNTSKCRVSDKEVAERTFVTNRKRKFILSSGTVGKRSEGRITPITALPCENTNSFEGRDLKGSGYKIAIQVSIFSDSA